MLAQKVVESLNGEGGWGLFNVEFGFPVIVIILRKNDIHWNTEYRERVERER